MRIGVLDLVTKSPNPSLYGRVMNPNLASFMPQAIAVWCEQLGHEVHFVCYTGRENLTDAFPADLDLVFVGAFTQSALLAYALSNRFRQRGAVTVIGGPHARCYPEDAQKYFDYVLGFTDKAIITEVLQERAPHRPLGRHLFADRQPADLPSLPERWKYVEATLAKAPTIKIVPMIASLGCPYTCSFCIDSTVPYQPLGFEQLRDDLAFLLTKHRNPIVGWHDPNFGVRFDDSMAAIEAAVPPGRMRHVAESSLSLLSEPHLARLRKNGFQAILPGIESWYDMGNKSKTTRTGLDKVKQVAEHVNLILRYIPYIQTNFVLGLDCDEGAEPFELTKKFLDLAPGAFPAYSLLSSFGQAAPLNLEYQRQGRVLPFPFFFLNNNHAMNVRPKNYAWPEFYDRLVDLTSYSFTWGAIARRFRGTPAIIPKWMNVVRGVSSEGFGRVKYHTSIRRLLDSDRSVRHYMDGETDQLPEFYHEMIRRDMGELYQSLPAGALEHDPNAYLKAVEAAPAGTVQLQARAGTRNAGSPNNLPGTGRGSRPGVIDRVEGQPLGATAIGP